MFTTSQKIIIAFTVSIVIMAILAFLGYRGLTDSGVGYRNSNRLSTIDIAISNTLRSLNNTAYFSTVFLRTGDPNDMQQALGALRGGRKILDGAAALVLGGTRLKDLKEIDSSITQFEKSLTNLQEHRTNATINYENTTIPALRTFEKQLDLIVNIENAEENISSITEIARLWPTLSALDSNLATYMATQQFDDGEALEKELMKLGVLVQELEGVLFNYESIAAYKELKQAYQNIYDDIEALRLLIAASRTSNFNREENLNKTRELAVDFNESFAVLRASRNAAFESESEETQAQTLTIATIGLLITIAFATFIIFSISGTFKKLSTYFVQIAKGNFNAQSGITEKGAIGAMVEGMQEIPNTLNAIIKDSNNLAEDILKGHFRNRFDTSAYSGGFSTLGDSINSLANTYTTILDTLPTPFMVADTEHTIIFLNTFAQTMLGGNKVQQKCGATFNAPECGTGGCFGADCMKTKKDINGITMVTINGKPVDLNIQAASLFDQRGNVVAFVETFTDISEIKNQQRLIVKTASEAAEIADRVASATEELSAQVEQTNLGTNEQKRQVESTASAMHEMNSTVLEVARNAGQTSTQTEETLGKAHNGAELVSQVVQSINAVNNVATTLQNNMQELGTQADNIGSVMNTISDIADQTNLLALNAAIEAARAGDAGRGFAVVADEVRKLAEKTMNATHEVGQSISTIQNSIRINISEVTNAVDSVAQATGLANSSGVALGEIVELVTSNSQLVSSIATAAEQQSSTSEEINRALGEINMVVNEISTSMGQSSQAVGELSNMAQQLRSLMKKLG